MRDRDALTWDDARAIFQLLGELRELGHDPLAWRTQLLQGIGRLVDARVGVIAEAELDHASDPGRYAGTLDLGWQHPGERAAWAGTCQLTGVHADPTTTNFCRVAAGSFTVSRSALAADAVWYRSSFVNERLRAAGIDDYLVSHQRVPELGALHMLLIYRPWGAPLFTRRELRRVDRLHAELIRLWRSEPASPVLALSPRLRQTLTGLAQGDSEKQVAARLGISASTVHDYVKALHRHFGVHSRGELLARAAERPRRPLLVLEQRRLTQPASPTPRRRRRA